MRNFTSSTAKKILANEISMEVLLQQYPEYQEEVLQEIGVLRNGRESKLITAILDKYTVSAKIAHTKIQKSRFNETTINAFLPDVIKARFAIYLLEQLNIAVSSKTPEINVKLNLWDGTILQKLLFRKGLERKPVSLGLFKFWWRFVIHKKILMPLVNKKGIYCFYSRAFIKELSSLIGNQSCLEIAAGDGTLTKFLKSEHINCQATDDYSWSHYIVYPSFVEKADAKTALLKYTPQVVLCSWPVPKNAYEKHVFKTPSVDLYIVIGTKNPAFTGDFDAYYNADKFTMELDEKLSSLILPPSDENAVYLFRRKRNSSANLPAVPIKAGLE
ncbi:SAM-dependent methyltransferase [Bacillus sp. FJAT-27264]|uniref:SAM-dependent methyltransferase n=1 Tax=Paenibacillus sp. (strain DSM 101736 / FJAT-27264) TaxID=1850362 RepID=UPI000807AE2B|nr:SAM-dependent methyltransferase [Bacillus sp. FJAT-27264]OBZ08973.1 SAM-dependent methyltransferase [Bacillus sp. FJAT-27264]